MKKRDFIKTGLLGAVGFATLPSFAGRTIGLGENKQVELPELPYRLEDLEPHLNRETLKIHYHEHHAEYFDKLKSAMLRDGVRADNARKLIKEASRHSQPLINNAGGYVNHNIYWKSLSPKGGGLPSGKIGGLIERDFGSYARFRRRFREQVKQQSGSGWTWLVIRDRKLDIVNTSNNDNPLMDFLPYQQKGHPLLCIDLWEHAYYLQYQESRHKYVDAFWSLVDWDRVNKRLFNSKQA
ncbi:MAG: superoxide dismutase [Bacteroidales bacterium]|nr:superoxide dismutase [Bacteroidales bacterium]